MFPIPWNKLFRKKDGSIVTIEEAISSGGGGGYELPTATASRLGGVKIGSGVTVQEDGTISVTGGSLPAYSSSDAGKVLTVGDDGSIIWNEVTSEYGVYTTLLVGRPAFKPSSISGKYNIAATTLPVSSQPYYSFTTDNYNIDDVYIPDAFDNFEFYNDVTADLITELGLELIFESLESATTSVALNDPITDYSAIVIQGCYGASGTSDYDTTIIYVNPKINSNYWFGMKDRNNSYSGVLTFSDTTHGTIDVARRLKIYGIPNANRSRSKKKKR